MTELNTLSYERYIQFLQVDLTAFSLPVYRFVDTTDFSGSLPETSTITHQGFSWTCYPFQVGGFQRGGENLVRPSVQLFDYTGELYATLRTARFGAGAPVTLFRAFADDVIAGVNGPFMPERYVMVKPSKTGATLDLELATHLDFATRKFPGFIMTREDYPGLGSAILRG